LDSDIFIFVQRTYFFEVPYLLFLPYKKLIRDTVQNGTIHIMRIAVR